jgi:hypothetical protein
MDDQRLPLFLEHSVGCSAKLNEKPANTCNKMRELFIVPEDSGTKTCNYTSFR